MPSTDLSAGIRQSARRFLSPGSLVAVAVSGGVDSIVLLHVLAVLRSELELRITAVHVNHGLSANADDWENFCSAACAALDVPFAATHVNLAPAAGESLEALARQARYAALERAAADAGTGIIALAQHADDQVETVLLQLLRGAASKGLAAMPEWRCAGSGCCFWRPMLRATRQEIVGYARRHALRWIEDESNVNPIHKRNYLRTQVMPQLAAGFPGYRTSLARTATHAAEAAQLLDELADLDAGAALTGERVSLAVLRELGALRAGNLLRRMLARRGFAVPPSERLAEFIRQTFEAAKDRHPALQLGNRHVLRADGGYIALVSAPLAGPFVAPWHGQSAVVLPHGSLLFEKAPGKGIRAAMIPAAGLCIRSREGGERLKIAANRPHRSLKNLMQEACIPAALRDSWPLLVHAGGLVAIPGIGVGVDWQCPAGEMGWGIEWRPSASNHE